MAMPLILRWPDREPAHDRFLAELGADRVIGNEAVPGSVDRGLWPGIASMPKAGGDADIAGASREPWVDSSGYLAAYERALHPERSPLLGHSHKDASRGVPFDSLELALIEARVNGGNFILSVEPRYRAALIANDPAARESWRSLARTAAWMGKNEALFGRPAAPILTALVEPGRATAEIANLLYRRSGSPRLAAATQVPKPDPVRIAVLCAAGLQTVPESAYAHAAAGSTVVIDSAPSKAWKRVKEEPDRDVFAFGKGQIIAYHKRVADPSEFALDLIDLVTHKRRAARLWNALSAIPLATEGGLLHIIQYGGPITNEVQVRMQGMYTRATLLRPEAAPLELKIFRRGTMTEVFPPAIQRLAVVQFE